MIYTLTFNPALDYVMYLDGYVEGATNRSYKEKIFFGGKGVNVSCVLNNLGVDTTVLGFIAGFTGDSLEKHLKAIGIKTDFIRLKEGNTRINVKLKGEKETEINASGPQISKEDISVLFERLDRIQKGDTLVLSGSVPKSVDGDIYKEIISTLGGRGIRFVVDAAGELLIKTLSYNPFLVKPNLDELEEISKTPLKTIDDISKAAISLKEGGAVNVLVSMGADGALLVDENGNIHRKKALGGKPVNTVGAGDSMVAGFLAGYDCGCDYALKLALAAGGATACSEGIATKEEIENLI